MPERTPRDFRTYATIEAANIILVPGAALLLAPPDHAAEIVAMLLAVVACAGFLLMGARYWAALDKRLKHTDRRPLISALILADRLEVPLLIATIAAATAVAFGFFFRGSTWSLIAAAALTALAALEYVNYYHWQLQHFDRWSDFARLIKTRRLRRAHMARALAAHRKPR